MTAIPARVTVAALVTAMAAAIPAHAAPHFRYCGNATPYAMGTWTQATPNVSCADAFTVLHHAARCPYTRRPHTCTVGRAPGVWRCRITSHTAYDGAGYGVTHCYRGSREVVGKQGP